MKIPKKKSIVAELNLLAEDNGWHVDSSISDIASYVRRQIKRFYSVAYDEGFFDGEMETQDDCLCDCKHCEKCEYKK